MTRITDEYRKLQPLIVSEIRAALQGLQIGASSGSGTAPDLTGYLTQTAGDARYLKLGGGTMTGNIGMPALGTVDGVDMSVHILDPDAHHVRQHGILTAADHSMIGNALDLVGLTATNTLGKLTPSSTGAANSVVRTGSSGETKVQQITIGSGLVLYGDNDANTVPDIDLVGNGLIVAQQNMYFGIDSDESTAPGSNAYIWRQGARNIVDGSELMRLTEAGRLGIGDSTPSYELDVAGSGQFQTSVLTPTLTTASGALTASPTTDIVLTPGSNLVKLSSGIALQSANFASQATGMRINYAGQADFRYIYTDELHAKAFIADLEQALAGGQIITKSVTLLATAFTVPGHGVARSLVVRDLPSATGMAVFEAGDCVALRAFSRAGGGLTIGWAYGTVASYSDGGDGTQTWTWTRLPLANNAGGSLASGTVINAESIVLDFGTSGTGYHEINAIDGVYGANSPYAQIVTWSNTSPGYTGAQTVRTRTGNLNGLFGDGAEYGFFAGSGTSTSDQYVRLSDRETGFYNLASNYYLSGTQTGNIAANGTFWFGPSSADKRLEWNGTTLNIVGSGTFSGSITATSGTIAGWSITSSMIQASNELIRIVHGAAGIGRFEVRNNNAGDATTKLSGIMSRSTTSGVVFFAGATTDYTDAPNAPFRVTMAGALTATNATLTGSLTAGNVSITPTDAMLIGVGATHADAASIRFMRSGTKEGQVSAYSGYMTVSANGILFLSAGTQVMCAPGVPFLTDDTISADKFKAYGTTGYLSVLTTDVLSWTATALTSAVDVTAPALRVASGTGYLKVGSTNVASWTSTALQSLVNLGSANWTALTYNTAFHDPSATPNPITATGTVYYKKFGDMVHFRGTCTSDVTTGDRWAFNLPTGTFRSGSVFYVWAIRASNSTIRCTIDGNNGVLIFTNYTQNQTIYFDGLAYYVDA